VLKQIRLNGEPRGVPEGLSLENLLVWLKIDPSRVAVERNRSIARKADWPATPIHAGDRLEIVWFVGGG
jgi:thiamine biosynthesis protein ThiS